MRDHHTRGGLRAALLGAALLAALAPCGASAQEAEAPAADATSEAAAAEAGAVSADAAAAAPRGPLPIMVVVLPQRRVPDEAAAAARDALVAQLTPMAGRRPVHPLGAAALQEAIAACSDDACVGGQLASAQAQAGVLLRLRRTRSGLRATLELRDPVSGAMRGEAVEGDLPNDPAAIPEALAALSAQLEPAMPSPPPPPATLLVTVNVDGAQIKIDGQDVGAAPVSAVEVAEGSHEVQVMAPGYLSVQRRTEVRPGEQARLDVTLRELGTEVQGATGAGATGGEGAWAMDEGGDDGELIDQWWFWLAVGGGAAVLIGIAIGVGVAVSDQGMEMVDPQGIELPPIVGGT